VIARRAVGSLAALLACSCGQGATTQQPVQRFSDTAPGIRAGAPPTTATIDGDTRMVPTGFPATRLQQTPKHRVERGRVRFPIDLPERLGRHESLVLEVFGRPWGEAIAYRRIHTARSPVRSHGDRATLLLDFPLAGDGADRPVNLALYVDARVPPASSVEVFETPEVTVPAGSALEFALGILEAAWQQGPVEFAVRACEAGICEPVFAETLDPGDDAGGRWRPRRVDLGDREGSRVSFRFETRHQGDEEASFSLPVWANPTLLAPVPTRRSPRSLILVSIDTLRADHLGSYGYARETSPFLDAAVAARGTLLETAIAPCSTTSPSHMTLFTSLQPSVHAVRGSRGPAALPAGARTLAEALRADGFATAAVTEGGGLALGRGFERGFETFVENPGPVPHRPGVALPVTLHKALEWLLRHRERRFFLFLHTYEVHGPYAAPSRYVGLFADGGPDPVSGIELPSHRRPVDYDREIRFTDDELRAFVERLEHEGLLEDTLLVVTSDHGEEFLEHGNLGHGATLPEEVLRVPLLLMGPRIPVGHRVDAPVGLVDLAPTVLELLGAPGLPGAMGRSFAALLRRGGDADRWRARPIYSEAWYPYRNTGKRTERVSQPTLAVRLGDRKLVRYRTRKGHGYNYFDLATDPGERRDLYAERPDEASDLRELLERYEAETSALHADLTRAGTPGSFSIDPERELHLQALGYLD
jgi:hypothetical protein